MSALTRYLEQGRPWRAALLAVAMLLIAVSLLSQRPLGTGDAVMGWIAIALMILNAISFVLRIRAGRRRDGTAPDGRR